MSDQKMLALLAAAIEDAGGVRAFARRHKLSPAYVSDVRLGKRGIGPRIAEALGFRVKITRIVKREYVRA
jgi:hypothetical protein